MNERYTRLIPYLLILVAFTYYSILSAKHFTWIFVSADSGDWLAASQMWFVPQPLGSPLFILMGQFLNLFPGDLVVKMTILLSCLPAAITVGLVYLIARRMTGRVDIGVVCSLIVLGATVLLTQATVLEEYASTLMLLTLAFWLYLSGRRYSTGICLALGTAIHVIVLPVALLWLAVERKAWRTWVKPAGVYIGIVAAFYSLILLIMASDAPPYMAGNLNWFSLFIYTTGTAGIIVGTASLWDFPMIVGRALGMAIISLGLAIVPITYGLKRPVDRPVWILLITIFFFFWYHTTNLDPSTWTFLTFAVPSLAILAGLGLTRLSRKHLQAVAAGACFLILFNGVFMNASTIAEEHNEAEMTLEIIESLPQDSAIVLVRGHFSLATYYAISNGRDDLVPIVYRVPEAEMWPDYEKWMDEEWGITGNTTMVWVHDALSDGRDVYMLGEDWRYEASAKKMWPHFVGNFSFTDTEYEWFRKVESLHG